MNSGHSLVYIAMLVLLSALAPMACSDGTAGEFLSFETAVAGTAESGAAAESFTNGKGWRITLSAAALAVGPIYYYSSEAQSGLLDRLLGVKTAYACPAHAQFDKGTVLGEVRSQYVIDLLDGTPVSTGISDGEKGLCRMFELHFHPPGEIPAGSDDAALETLGGHSFVIAGVAEKNGVSIRFSGHLTIPDEGTMRIVESIPADVELDGRPGRAVTLIYTDRQLANVDFGRIVNDDGTCIEETGDGACVIDSDSQAYLAWLFGVRSRQSYALEWRE